MFILVITETLSDTCPTSQFLVNGFFVPFRLDWNRNGAEIMIYFRDNILNGLLAKYVLPGDIDGYSMSWLLEKSSCYYLKHITHHFKMNHIVSIV